MLKGGDYLKRIVFEDINDIVQEMIGKLHDGADVVSAVCFYELATAIAEELIREDCSLDFAEIWDYEYNHYDKEYAVVASRDSEGNMFVEVEPIYRNDGYLLHYSDVAYVHEDCNSKLLKHLDAEEMYEFAVSWVDDEDPVPGMSEYTHVSRAVDGSPTGFSKSWYSTDDTGKSSYTSYSFISDNKNLLEKIAESWNIKL